MVNSKTIKKFKKYTKPTLTKTVLFTKFKKDNSTFIDQFLLAADQYVWDAY